MLAILPFPTLIVSVFFFISDLSLSVDVGWGGGGGDDAGATATASQAGGLQEKRALLSHCKHP